jgi:phage FluMu gp28-like protein
MANVGWRLITRLSLQIPQATINKSDRIVTFANGGEIAVRSADNPDSLRGEGLDLAILDECAFMQESAWTEAIRPALSDRKGRAIFISTPKGRNWFWRLFQQGIAGDNNIMSWQLPTVDNPYIDPSEVDAARQSLPERVYRQEFLAEFIDDAGGVFRRVVEAATAVQLDSRAENGQYVFGVDWGQQNDFTVIVVMDIEKKSMVHIDRFNQIDYNVQRGRLVALYERFRPLQVVAESNAMGLPIIQELQRQNVPISPFTTTNASKTAAIDALALAFEQSVISILPDAVLVGELQAYEQEKLPSGLRKFGAPSGLHDDTVMALAMAWQGCAGGNVFLW